MKTKWEIDPAHSSAQFTVRHMMISNVRGGFSRIKGSVVYDPENPSETGVEAAIDATSINTLDDQRDTHLKSADFLDVAAYPNILFRSKKVTPTGPGEGTVVGDITIHGVTKEIVLKVEGPSSEGKDPWGNTRMGASASTKLKRSDFGLTWNAVLETGGIMVGDELKIDLEIQMIKVAENTVPEMNAA